MTRPSIAFGDPLPPESLPTGIASALLAVIERFPQGRFTHIDTDGEAATVSYVETLAIARRILGGLQRRGFRAGDRVVLHLSKSSDFTPAAWAALLGGGVIAPLMRRERSRRHARTAVETLSRLNQVLGAAWLVMDALDGPALALDVAELSRGPEGEPATGSGPDDLRLLVLTSGTTTTPRLVQLTERAVIARWWPNVPAAEQAQAHLTWSPFDHIMGLGLVGPNLAHKIALAPDRFVASPIAWLDAVERHGVTHATMTNSGLGMIEAAVAAAAERSWDLSSLYKLGVGAEAISPRMCRRFMRALAPFGLRPDVMILGYGLSECGPVAGGGDCFMPDNDADLLVALDRPTRGHAIRITDARDAPLSEGEIGAVQVRGPTMTTGYLGDPDATRALFTDDDWMRTGDLGFLRDERVTIVGREKEQIIIHGEKYACAAIEAVGEGVEGVAAAYAAPCRDRSEAAATGERFALFFIRHDGADDRIVAAQISDAVAAAFGLAPTALVSLQAQDIPRTPSGKVQRHELGAGLDSGRFDDAVIDLRGERAAFAAFAGDRERAVAAVWSDTLGQRPFGAEDDFFTVGGDSIAAVRMVLGVEAAFGVRLPETILHRRTTVRSLAAWLEGALPSAAPLLPVDIEERLLALTSDWIGQRVRPDSLLRGLNLGAEGRPWFWCVQFSSEMEALHRIVGEAHPLYGMRSGLSIMDYEPETVRALASRYLAELLALDPTGPYFLGGLCQGCFIVRELARQLQSMGREVALLALIDTPFWDHFKDEPYRSKVACFSGVGSRFNPWRHFRSPERGWRKVMAGGLRLSVVTADHLSFWVEPALSELSVAVRSATAWALESEPEPEPTPMATTLGALPAAAYWMSIQAPEAVTVKAGAAFSVPLRITNASPTPWPADAGLGVGNHWLRASGEMAIWADGRGYFAQEIPSGATGGCDLPMRAPAEPGRYLIEFDLVEEGVTWFKIRGAVTAYTIAHVQPA